MFQLNRIYLSLIVFFLAMLFAGCPYSSTVPIDKPGIKVREEFLGVWEDPKNDNENVYIVGKYDNFTYKIEHVLNDSAKKPEKYLGHISFIDTTTFLNLKSVESFVKGNDDTLSNKYYFLKIENKGGLMTLSGVTNNITERFNSSDSLREFIRKNMKNSYFYLKKYMLLINKSQIEKNERQIIQLSKEKIIQELELEKNKSISAFAFSALLIVSATALLFWFYSSNKQKTGKLIAEKKELSAMLSGQELERKRIATDLHDRLGSMLATVKLYFNSVEEGITQMQQENRDQYEKAIQLLDASCDEVRKISHNLNSGILKTFGIVSALNELKETVSNTNLLQMNVITSGLDQRLDPVSEKELYMIIQELTKNVIIHAEAENLTVMLSRTGDRLHLLFSDDGKGFQVNPDEKHDGIGLRNINERVKKMNGTLSIESSKGKGTIVNIEIPV